MRELRSKQFWFSWLGVLLGAFIVAAGFVLFTNPYNIVPGGVYGLGCAFHKLVPSIATGTFGLMMDIPLMITGFLIFGAKFGAKTVFAALITPVIMNGMTALVGDSSAVSEGVGFIAHYLNFSNTLLIPSICGGIVQTVMGGVGGAVSETATLPSEIVTAIEEVGFLQSIPLWLVSFLGSLLITVLSFVLILTVYGRFFRLYMYTALSPVPLASLAGEGTASMGKAFIKSYVGVCMEGAVIILACLIYSAFLSSGAPAVDPSLPAVTMAYQYVGQVIFNMLVLTAMVKGAERIVREMFGL